MRYVHSATRLGTVLTGVLFAACAHRVPAEPASAPAAPDSAGYTAGRVTDDRASGAIALRVESHHSNDVVIYVVRGSVRHRLGTVTAATTRQLAIPGRFAAEAAGFYLVAHAIGSPTSVGSDVVSPQPGQTVVWTLASALERSEIAIE